MIDRCPPLGCFSPYSFGEGVCPPVRMAAALAAAGQPVLPLTDVMGFWALVPAVKAAAAHGLQPLIGMLAPLADGFLLLYPDDEAGYSALARAASAFHRHPGRPLPATGLPDWLHGLTGRGRAVAVGSAALAALADFSFPGWQPFWGISADASRARTEAERPLAARLGAPPVAVILARFAHPADRLALRVLRAIHQNALVDRMTVPPAPTALAGDALAAPLSWFPEAIAGARAFAAVPSWTPPLGRWHLPRLFADPAEAHQRLAALARHGAATRYGSPLPPAVAERLAAELRVIADLGFADYFLLVHEIVTEAERQGHRVLGRGSAANSLVSYALRFTHVDPLRHHLYFERFLNPERTTPPDIDLDFSWRIRDDIYRFLQRRWGDDQVALISTHVTLGGRGALRETGKALGFPPAELARFTRAIGHRSIAEFLAEARTMPAARGLPLGNPVFHRLLRVASRLEGLPTHLSLHAGGVVVAPGGIHRFTPVQPTSKPVPMTQMEMHAIEAVGLVKIDLLAQRSLGVFADVVGDLARQGPLPAVLEDVDALAADPPVAEALAAGRTMGVFYIESPGMRSLLARLRCRGFAELTAASSVIRPGVAESGMMQAYIARHHAATAGASVPSTPAPTAKPVPSPAGPGRAAPSPADRSPAGGLPGLPPGLHPLFDEVLRETYGIMIYQEDVMKVAHAVAGFTLGEADLLRRAMSGKERGDEIMARSRSRFLEGAAARGVPAAVAEEIWRQMASFSGYAFCKAHSASYAVLSLQLLWMKCHHPALFMAAVLDNRGGFYGPQAYLSETRRLGVAVLPPDVARSGWNCRVIDGAIVLGLSFVKGLSRATADRLLAAQVDGFASLEAFLDRVRPDDAEFAALNDSGALARFGPPAAVQMARTFARGGGLLPGGFVLPSFVQKPAPRHELAQRELRGLGLLLSAHPLDLVALPPGLLPSDRLPDHVGRVVRLAGVLIARKPVTTKRGERMQFLTLEDRLGPFEVTVFPPAWRRWGHVLSEAGEVGVIGVEGRVAADWGTLSLEANRLFPIPLRSFPPTPR
ncbi:MAG: DNA polymerase III alpha subunit [Candidatus Ozemobacter sibiricus]|uniref:DNA-directed DNA polymerase n=1 Tax=Candidatus Ozemobacter sibiricus TaxID=2268124 RepID=A0A367ZN81_9BACT|nr:MAG: DNA polymerase III alpha subunit [Candidatus Ozemobacter sibiricus]